MINLREDKFRAISKGVETQEHVVIPLWNHDRSEDDSKSSILYKPHFIKSAPQASESPCQGCPSEASSQPGRARCPSAGDRSGVLRDIATESNSLIMIPSPTRRMARGPWRRPGRRHWYYRLGVTVMAARARYRVPRASAGRPNGSGAPRLGQRPPRPSTSAGNLSDRRRR